MDDNNFDEQITALLNNRTTMELSELTPAKYNPHEPTEADEEAIMDSIERFGYLDPIVVNTRDGKNVVVGGHLRLRSLLKKGIERAEVVCVDLDETEEKELNMILNYRSKYDMERLANLVVDLNTEGVDVFSLGLDQRTVEQFLKEDALSGAVPVDEPETDKEEDEEPDSQEGMVYQLGPHRLMCGDATNPEHVKKLFNGDKCSCVATDPPYGVDYNSKNQLLALAGKENSVQKDIANDDILSEDDYIEFTKRWASLIPFSEPNTFYSFINGKMLLGLALGLRAAGLKVSQFLVWVKNHSVIGRMDYLLKHEFIIYGWKGTHKFYGKKKQSVFEFDKPTKSKLHPTMKPLSIMREIITDGSGQDAIVYDPFGGSGTTLIACDQMGRRCYMMEKDPHYCDVIRKRWEDHNATSQL